MNHEDYLPHADESSPSFHISGASVAKVFRHEGVLTLGANEASCLSMKKSENEFVVDIHRSLNAPLIIDCDFSTAIYIRTEAFVHASILMPERASGMKKLLLLKNAHVDLYVMAEPSPSGESKRSAINIDVETSAHLRFFGVDIGEQTGERTIDVSLLGTGAHVEFFGLNQLHGIGRHNVNLTIFHHAKNTTSTQAFRGMYAGSSQGVFLGKVVIDPRAEKCRVSQLYKAIILNKGAKAHVMPQLEINNQNIAASHGASIGELDESIVFYISSRGISNKDAKMLLVSSFLDDIVDNIDVAHIKNFVQARLLKSIKHSLEENHD